MIFRWRFSKRRHNREALGMCGTEKYKDSALPELFHTLVAFILHAVEEGGVERDDYYAQGPLRQ